MTGSTLYSRDILRLATSLEIARIDPADPRSAELRSPACGSVMRALVEVEHDRIRAIRYDARACALGQAAAALVQARGVGMSVGSLAVLRSAIADLLAGDDGPLAAWPALAPLAAARAHPARHGSIMLAIDTPIAALAGRAERAA